MRKMRAEGGKGRGVEEFFSKNLIIQFYLFKIKILSL